MSALEDRVRDALRADAATVRPDSLPGVPARPGRRGFRRASFPRIEILIPLAAAAAVVAVVTGVAVIVPHGGTPGAGVTGVSRPASHFPSPCRSPISLACPGLSTPPVNNAPLPMPVLGGRGRTASRGVPAAEPSPGIPQYYVTVNQPPGANSLVVRATATGAVVGTIDPPRGVSFDAIAATAGNRTFITAVVAGTGCTGSQLYQFQLNGQGVPGPLTPLNIAIPGVSDQYGTLAITADGTKIAYDTSLCGKNQGENEISVIDLATGHIQTWGVNASDQFTGGLSLSASGNLLAYQRQWQVVEILRTNEPLGSLFQRSQVVSPGAGWGALAGDGATLYTCSVTAISRDTTGSVTYDAQSLSGSGRRVIARWNHMPYPQCWASLEPSGHYLLVQYPVPEKNASSWVQPAVLDTDTGQLTRIAAPSYYGPADVAW